MKKVLSAIVVGMLVFVSVAFAEPFSIRNEVKFGDSKDRVISLETLSPISDTSSSLIEIYNFNVEYMEKLGYKPSYSMTMDPSEYIYYGPGIIAGVPNSNVEYHFNNGQLTAVAYQFRLQNAQVDFSLVSKALESKYGTPISDGSSLTVGIGRRFGDSFYEFTSFSPGGGLTFKDKICEEWIIPLESNDIKIEHIFLEIESNVGFHCLAYSLVEKLDIVNVDSDDL